MIMCPNLSRNQDSTKAKWTKPHIHSRGMWSSWSASILSPFMGYIFGSVSMGGEGRVLAKPRTYNYIPGTWNIHLWIVFSIGWRTTSLHQEWLEITISIHLRLVPYSSRYIIYIYIYLEPNWPLFLKVNPPKEGPFHSKQGSFGFQVYTLDIIRSSFWYLPWFSIPPPPLRQKKTSASAPRWACSPGNTWSNGSKQQGFPTQKLDIYPQDPYMVYLPTFGWFLW